MQVIPNTYLYMIVPQTDDGRVIELAHWQDPTLNRHIDQLFVIKLLQRFC